MAHHIYTTDAYILESALNGEADAFLTIFTRDLGLLRANARGIKRESSKLRYSLQDFSEARVSLVRGKELWRVTNARLEENIFTKYRNKKEVLWVVANIFLLIKRLVGEEEKNETLFAIIKDGLSFLGSSEPAGAGLKHFEIIMVLKILNNLGYMADTAKLGQYINSVWSQELLASLSAHKTVALREINTALRETQL